MGVGWRLGKGVGWCTYRGTGSAYMCMLPALGTMIGSDGSMNSKVEQRVGMVSRMVGAIGSMVLGRKEVSKGTKLRVVNAMVIPTLMYGCEAWALQVRHKGGVQAMQMRVLRWIEGVSRLDRVRNIKSRLGREGVANTVMRRQQEWKQRVEEMSDGRVTKMVYNGDVSGKRL